jgi:V/A-type H+-transporting ATPase subunit I
MAVEAVQRMTIIAHKSLEDAIVEALRRLYCVHVERVTDLEMLAPKELDHQELEGSRQVSLGISQVEFLLTFLKEHSGKKPGFLKTMVKDKYPMTLDEFERSGHRIDLDLLYAECSEYQRRLVEWQDQQDSLEKDAEELENWTELQLALDDIKSSPTSCLVPLRVATAEVQALRDQLEVEAPASELETMKERGAWTNCLLLYHPSVAEEVRSILKQYATQEVALPAGDDEPRDRLAQVRRELTAIKNRRERTIHRVAGLQENVPALEVFHELLVDKHQQIAVTSLFGVTRSVVQIQGWVTQNGKQRVLEAIEALADDVVADFTDPVEGDNPPVSLKNPRWARPFEMLVTMYGSPNRLEYDPTVILAISFATFFGFCIGDAGYGVVLIIVFWLLRKHLPLGQKARDLLVALTYGAGMAIVFGILTGSYFGIDTKELPTFLKKLAVLDPLGKTLLVMGVCIGIGVVHMLAGTAVEFRDNWRHGNRADALIDQGLVILLFAGGGLAGILAALHVIPAQVVYIIIFSAIALMLLLLGRSAKSIPGKIVNGLYETYGTVIGFISDAISYVRLFALGLATYIIGLVINTMAGLTRGIAPPIGIVIMVLILVVGHTFNVVINLLGAFVHPLRLEFVEFFGKFYDDGGSDFKPFGVDSKIVMITDKPQE